MSLESLRESLPDQARDIKVNLQNVLGEGVLAEAQRYGVAIACAYFARHPTLGDALVQEAIARGVPEGTIDDAKAAAYLMAMNNVFYSAKKLMGERYEKPARLRMQRIAKVTSTKVDFELFCMAASAIGKCEPCLKSHEEGVLKGGLTEDHVFDAIRIASTVNATVTGLIGSGVHF